MVYGRYVTSECGYWSVTSWLPFGNQMLTHRRRWWLPIGNPPAVGNQLVTHRRRWLPIINPLSVGNQLIIIRQLTSYDLVTNWLLAGDDGYGSETFQ